MVHLHFNDVQSKLHNRSALHLVRAQAAGSSDHVEPVVTRARLLLSDLTPRTVVASNGDVLISMVKLPERTDIKHTEIVRLASTIAACPESGRTALAAHPASGR